MALAIHTGTDSRGDKRLHAFAVGHISKPDGCWRRVAGWPLTAGWPIITHNRST